MNMKQLTIFPTCLKILNRRLLLAIAILLAPFPFADRIVAQTSPVLNIDVDKLADTMWAPIFKELVEGNLFLRDYKCVYRYCYNEIYKRDKGKPTPIAYYYMGACLEMGMGTNEVSQYKAKAHYEKGAALGNKECKERLQSIKSKGYWSASAANKEAFAKRHGRATLPPTPVDPDYPGPVPPGPNDNSVTCSGCHGSGRCTYCGGDGKVVVDAGLYVSYDHYVYKTCEVCNGSGRCGTCYGYGRISY